MRRLLAGSALAAGAMFMAPSVEAQQDELCADVYDETATGDSSVALRQEIGEYALSGVEVHVQIFEDATDNGIQAPEDAAQVAEDLAAQCGWGEDRLNVLISVNPRAYDINRVGRADADISDSAVNNAEASLVDDLRNSSTTFQSDAANLLVRLNPYDFVPGPVPSSPNEGSADTEDKQTNIPWALIGGGIVGAAALGGAGARTSRGLRIKKTVTHATNEANGASGSIAETLTSVEAQLSVLPADDALQLREMSDKAEAALLKVGEARDGLDSLYKKERTRLWPAAWKIDEHVEFVDGVTSDTKTQADSMAEELKEIEAFIASIDERVAGFTALLTQGQELAAARVAEGWDIGLLAKSLETYVQVKQTLTELRTNNYVEKPGTLIDEQEEPLAALNKTLEELDTRLQKADESYAVQAAQIKASNGRVTYTNENIEHLKSGYDKSCYQDIAAAGEQADALAEELAQINTTAAASTTIKSVTALEKTEKLNQEFAEVVSSIESHARASRERISKLEDIKREIPSHVADLERSLSEVHEFAFGRHEDDVEDETREEIEQLKSSFSTFTRSDIETDKPKYLELAERLSDFKTSVDQVTARARAEKEEMDTLRQDITHLESETERELRTLESYLSSHRSDIDNSTEADVQSITLIQGNTSAKRQSLRNQIERLQDLKNEINAAQSAAQADVRREEERREAERRRREEAAREAENQRRREREAAAAVSISHTSSSWDSGSSSSSGGGSDSGSSGSHDSGSW